MYPLPEGDAPRRDVTSIQGSMRMRSSIFTDCARSNAAFTCALINGHRAAAVPSERKVDTVPTESDKSELKMEGRVLPGDLQALRSIPKLPREDRTHIAIRGRSMCSLAAVHAGLGERYIWAAAAAACRSACMNHDCISCTSNHRTFSESGLRHASGDVGGVLCMSRASASSDNLAKSSAEICKTV
ncbi:hypothetical protein J6590_011976 [Homalodisca vitripennis]|nr:hypothetical protein J6590_011976 [Homalodisca vitripennis]